MGAARPGISEITRVVRGLDSTLQQSRLRAQREAQTRLIQRGRSSPDDVPCMYVDLSSTASEDGLRRGKSSKPLVVGYRWRQKDGGTKMFPVLT